MTFIPGGYKGYPNFEAYWQAGKVFEDVPHEISVKWWKSIDSPKRRYPGAKNKTVLHAKFDHIDKTLDYVDSRKLVYVPEYFQLVKDKPMTKFWQQKFNEGFNIVIYDFDGPRTDGGDVQCLKVTKDLLIDKINDTKFPFGHGYVVAATIAGISLDEFI